MSPTIKKSVFAVGVASLVVMAPAIANATPQDDQFLRDVASLGINLPADQLIPFGRTSCDTVGSGMGGVGAFYGFMAQTGLNAQQTYFVSNAGLKAYCPEKAMMVPPFMLPPGN